MREFNPQAYGPVCQELLDQLPRCPLAAGKPTRDRRSQLDKLEFEDLAAGRTIVDADMANCCLAGLWLAHNFLDESHTISQRIDTDSGSYWHGIMHRREPDFSNAKYWFRRVGQHAIFPDLAQAARQLAEGATPGTPASVLQGIDQWDPFQFVDVCQAALRAGVGSQRRCEEIAEAEWRLLFDHCYRHAFA